VSDLCFSGGHGILVLKDRRYWLLFWIWGNNLEHTTLRGWPKITLTQKEKKKYFEGAKDFCDFPQFSFGGVREFCVDVIFGHPVETHQWILRVYRMV
jgi:hypothetical protein